MIKKRYHLIRKNCNLEIKNEPLTRIDNNLSLLIGKLITPKPGIISLLIHTLFSDQQQIGKASCDPQQGIDLADLEHIIQFYLQRGYEFIKADQLLEPLNPKKKYCMLTFDDGYFNNLQALSILEKYNIPATFYVSTYHVIEQRSFWRDSYYRGRTAQGVDIQQIRKEKAALKTKRHDDIEAFLIQQFGPHTLTPVNDTDRPLTTRELTTLASHPLVCIGNHTHHHIIFDNYSLAEIKQDIELNQHLLTQIIGKKPTTIAYPNGNVEQGIHAQLKEMGIMSGLTTLKGKNYHPFVAGADATYHLKRFTPWHGQLDKFLPLTETDYHLKTLIKPAQCPY